MSFAASVGLLIICMIMQCQADLNVGDVANQDVCCRLIKGHGKECPDDFLPVCAMKNAKSYEAADNMCKFCGAYGNTTMTIVEIGDRLNNKHWPYSCTNGEQPDYGAPFKLGETFGKYDQ